MVNYLLSSLISTEPEADPEHQPRPEHFLKGFSRCLKRQDGIGGQQGYGELPDASQKTKARYIRDQLGIVIKSSKEYGPELADVQYVPVLSAKTSRQLISGTLQTFSFVKSRMDQVLNKKLSAQP